MFPSAWATRQTIPSDVFKNIRNKTKWRHIFFQVVKHLALDTETQTREKKKKLKWQVLVLGVSLLLSPKIIRLSGYSIALPLRFSSLYP